MHTPKLALGIGAVAILATGVGTVSAFDGTADIANHERKQPPLKEYIAEGDYASFTQAFADYPKFLEKIDQTTFNTLAEAIDLRDAGDTQAAKALLKDAGIKPHPIKRMKERRDRRADRQQARDAVQAGDYSAWQAAHENHDKILEAVTPEIFARMVEASDLHEAGEMEAAKALRDEIRDELGLPERPDFRKGYNAAQARAS